MSTIEHMMGESGPEVPQEATSEQPNQKVLDKGLHERAAENAEKAAAENQIPEPHLAQHLEKVASELHEVADAGVNPLDHVSKQDWYIAEAVHDTARVLDNPQGDAERPITYADFQKDVRKDHGYISPITLSSDHPKVQERVKILESVLGATGKHEVPSDDPKVKIEESATNVGVKLREVTAEGRVKMSVVKMARSRMSPPAR